MAHVAPAPDFSPDDQGVLQHTGKHQQGVEGQHPQEKAEAQLRDAGKGHIPGTQCQQEYAEQGPGSGKDHTQPKQEKNAGEKRQLFRAPAVQKIDFQAQQAVAHEGPQQQGVFEQRQGSGIAKAQIHRNQQQDQGGVPHIFSIAAVFLPQNGNRQIHELPPKDDKIIIESEGDKVNGGKMGK